MPKISEENKEEHHVSDSQHNEHYDRIQEEQVDSYTAQSPVPLMFENNGENNSNEDINKHGTDNEGTSDCYESVRDSPLTYHPFLENLQPVTLVHQLK